MPFSELIIRGENLMSLNEQDTEVSQWYSDCYSSINALFQVKGQGTASEAVNFRKADFPSGRLQLLKVLQYKIQAKSSQNPLVSVIQSVSQNQSLHIDITNQIRLNIEYADISEDTKKEAIELFNQVSEEVQKPDTNWDRVTNLLRRSFDYGLKIAPDIVKLADSYFKAKGIK